MKIREFKNEMSCCFDECSDTTKGFVSVVFYDTTYGTQESDGFQFVRLDDETIAYRIDKLDFTGDWEIERFSNEDDVNSFIEDMRESLTCYEEGQNDEAGFWFDDGDEE